MLVDRHGHSRQRNVKAPDVQWSPVVIRRFVVGGRPSLGCSSTDPQGSGRLWASRQQNHKVPDVFGLLSTEPQTSAPILPSPEQNKTKNDTCIRPAVIGEIVPDMSPQNDSANPCLILFQNEGSVAPSCHTRTLNKDRQRKQPLDIRQLLQIGLMCAGMGRSLTHYAGTSLRR